MHTFQYKTQDWIKNNYKEGNYMEKKLKIIIDKEIEHYYQFAQKKYLKPLEYRFAISKIERQLLLKEV